MNLGRAQRINETVKPSMKVESFNMLPKIKTINWKLLNGTNQPTTDGAVTTCYLFFFLLIRFLCWDFAFSSLRFWLRLMKMWRQVFSVVSFQSIKIWCCNFCSAEILIMICAGFSIIKFRNIWKKETRWQWNWWCLTKCCLKMKFSFHLILQVLATAQSYLLKRDRKCILKHHF